MREPRRFVDVLNQYLLAYKLSHHHFVVLLYQSLHSTMLLYMIYLKYESLHKNEPSNETKPHPTQITRHKPTDCVSRRTPFGETNIPEPIVHITKVIFNMHFLFLPIIIPTIKQTPENNPKCLLSVNSSLGPTSFIESGLTIVPDVKRRCVRIGVLLSRR